MFRTQRSLERNDWVRMRFTIPSNGSKINCIMRTLSGMRSFLFILALVGLGFCLQGARAQATSPAMTKILTPQDVSKIMPATVFFRGQSATVQMRNTFGLRFPDGALMLAGLVDSSGYSSGIRQKYQGYILSETPLTINGKTLVAGAYGFGFIANDKFVVMNLGAHDVLQVADRTDATMSRPRPLAIVAGKHPGNYRLYEGRKFVSIRVK